MNPSQRPWLLLLVGVILTATSAYAVLFRMAPAGRPGAFVIDVERMREIASANPALLPFQIESALIGEGSFPSAAVLAGSTFFESHPIAFVSYRIRYENRSVILDTANDGASQEEFFPGTPFYADAYAQMQEAMLKALDEKGAILFTHEHPDHLGGLAHAEAIRELGAIAMLTEEQLNSPQLSRSGFPDDAKKHYTPYVYRGLESPAPGIAVSKAPGHSPGSQLVFVALKDGREFLFIGDIAWDRANIETGIGRPFAVSHFFLHEDRQAVADQLVALKALQRTAPDLHIVVAHDSAQLAELRSGNLIATGFAD